jgi:AcrR family transcriptional regulator
VDRIVTATLAVVDVDGTAAVTMRRVAAGLGVTASSLYEHVRNREELLRLVLDEVVRQQGPPISTGDWQADLREYFLRLHRMFTAHGDIAALNFATVPTGPETLAAFELILSAVLEAGVPPEIAVPGLERLALYTTADAYEHWEFGHRARSGAAPTPEQVRAYFAALPADRFPNVRRYAAWVNEGSHQERFVQGLEMILAGMAVLAARPRPAS